jgi:superoxide dismutase
MHFKLYEGYVTQTNLLTGKIAEIIKDGHIDHEEMPAYSEPTRRLGFEYNGMVLHEYYFGNMKRVGSGDPERNSAFFQSGRAKFWQLRSLEDGFCRRWQNARGWMGYLQSKCGESDARSAPGREGAARCRLAAPRSRRW